MTSYFCSTEFKVMQHFFFFKHCCFCLRVQEESNANFIVTSVPSFRIIELNMKNREAHLKIMCENRMVFQELKQEY